MADILDRGQLEILSQLLRVRLAHRAIIDVNIISEDSLDVKIDRHHGRFIGCFLRRPTRTICFLLFIRSQERGRFDHAFVYYVNSPLLRIPESEKSRFIYSCEGMPKLGLVRVDTALDRSCDSSALLHAIEVTIGLHLVHNFKKTLLVHLNTVVTFVSPRSSAPLPSCNIATPSTHFKQLWDEIKSSNLVCVEFNCHGTSAISNDFDILRMKFKGHYYYGINYKHQSLMMLLVCHDALLRSDQDKEQLLLSLSNGFGDGRPNHIYASRFKSDSIITCCDKLILDACTKLRSFPLLEIKDIDVKALVRCENLDLIPKFGFDEPQPPQDDSADDHDDTAAEIGSSQRSISSVLTNDGYTGSITSDSTHVTSLDDLQMHLNDIQQASPQEPLIFDQLGDLDPFHDENDNLLHQDSLFMKFITQIALKLQSHASFYISKAVDFEELATVNIVESRQARFVLIPLLTIDVKALIVVDNEKKEWGYINASRLSHSETFNYVQSSLSSLEGYQAKKIGLSNSFHRGYHLVHLMMALNYLEKAFGSALLLPEILIYQEKDFRSLCHSICLRQQMVNQYHNLRNGLVQESGVLTAGAFVSYPSPIQYEPSVVKTNQCLFCRKRYSGNLSVHMMMQHGGRARLNRELRQQRAALSESENSSVS